MDGMMDFPQKLLEQFHPIRSLLLQLKKWCPNDPVAKKNSILTFHVSFF